MSRQAHWGIGLLLLQPLGAWALGLGEIELNSALNQPLNAEIRVISASPEEVDTLKVALASPETFQRYGLDRPSYLGDVAFSVGKDSRGRDVIKVETTQSVTEPFVTMLVEATWPRGRLLKEYTVLLDPPVLLPQPEAATAVQTPTANTPSTSQAGGRIQRPASPPAPIAAPRSSPAASRSMPSSSGGTFGPVQRNETLWRIAEQVRPDDRLTMNQMMVALYQANPEAFDGNINRLRRGAVLEVPAGTDIGSITTASANAEVRRQNQDWRGSAGVAEPGLRLVAPDDSQASAGQSTGAGDGDDTALRSEVQSLRDELAERDRLLAIRDQELQALQEQLASISETADMADVPPADGAADVIPEDGTAITDPGIDISDDELFADDQADTVPTDDVIEPEPAPTSSVTTVVTTAPEKSLLDTVIEWVISPFALMVAGALAVLIVGLWAVRRRQETATDITGRWEALEAEAEGDADGDDVGRDATARMRAQVAEPDTFVVEEVVPGEPTMPGIDPTTAEAALEDTPALFGDETLSSQTAINLDQADPVAEADFHMAYGLYDQAADLLEKAVNDEPDRRDLKLKLLEVFFVWDNKDSFRQTAQALRTEMGDGADADWDKVAIMGKQICPNDELFSEAVEGAAVDLDLDLEAGGEAPLDFSLEDSSAGAVDLDLGAAVADVGSPTAATQALPSIDIGDQTAAGLEAAFVLDADETGARTSPALDGLAETMESPTLEQPGVDLPTAESPALDETVEMPDASPTAESPTVEMLADSPTMESPTIETPMTELPTIEQPVLAGGDQTEEIDLNDLGLDLEALGQLPDDDSLEATGQELAAELSGDTRNREALSDLNPDDDLLSATGVTQVLDGDVLEHAGTEVLSDEDATMMASSFDEGTMARTEILPQGDDFEATNRVQVLVEDDAPDPGATSEFKGLDAGVDLDLDDLSAALDGGETVEQPGPGGAFPNAIFEGDGSDDLDLDIGSSVVDSDEPTATEQVGVMDPQTLTEVGTKLDLARAYIDMGDPEGARSILDEVLKEGDPSQRQEAEGLISGLGA